MDCALRDGSLKLQVLHLEPLLLQLRPVRQRLRDGLLDLGGLHGLEGGLVLRANRPVPEVRILRGVEDAPERVLRGTDRVVRDDHRLLAARDAGFGLRDLDRSQRPHLHLGLVQLQEVLREV